MFLHSFKYKVNVLDWQYIAPLALNPLLYLPICSCILNPIHAILITLSIFTCLFLIPVWFFSILLWSPSRTPSQSAHSRSLTVSLYEHRTQSSTGQEKAFGPWSLIYGKHASLLPISLLSLSILVEAFQSPISVHLQPNPVYFFQIRVLLIMNPICSFLILPIPVCTLPIPIHALRLLIHSFPVHFLPITSLLPISALSMIPASIL